MWGKWHGHPLASRFVFGRSGGEPRFCALGRADVVRAAYNRLGLAGWLRYPIKTKTFPITQNLLRKSANRGEIFLAEPITGLPELIEQGATFTYQNVGPKGQYGYPIGYSEDWLVWIHHVTTITAKLGTSPINSSIVRGLGIELLGNDEDNFNSAKALIVSGLKAADRIFGQDIPASDRTVSLGHNSPEQVEAVAKIDELIAAIEKANDFPGDDLDKQQIVAELSAGRRLLQATKLRIGALKETIAPALKFMMEKAAGSIVGKLANSAWDFFVGLHWL